MKKKTTFRMPYGWIAMGGVLDMIGCFFVSSPQRAFWMFILGMLVVIVSFSLAMCRRLDEDGPLFWPWGL